MDKIDWQEALHKGEVGKAMQGHSGACGGGTFGKKLALPMVKMVWGFSENRLYLVFFFFLGGGKTPLNVG